jgi:hypothetical protein
MEFFKRKTKIEKSPETHSNFDSLEREKLARFRREIATLRIQGSSAKDESELAAKPLADEKTKSSFFGEVNELRSSLNVDHLTLEDMEIWQILNKDSKSEATRIAWNNYLRDVENDPLDKDLGYPRLSFATYLADRFIKANIVNNKTK